ncbi:MAG: hypothetical protein NC184_00140 [Roseburia sp.]|nr:hypothetical protein [Roseburia sp.]
MAYSIGHTFAEDWSYDETEHWHAALCQCGRDSDRGEHNFKNDYCTVCQQPDASLFISDATSLYKIKDDTAKRNYLLAADIDMSDFSWSPFDFAGSINGNGHTIKNLSIAKSSGNCGVFSKLTGYISDIKFENLQVVSTAYDNVYVGSVCGLLSGGVIQDVTVSGSINCDSGYIGGIAGRVENNGSISNCVNNASVEGLASDTFGGSGGIVGEYVNGTISDSINNGRVKNKYCVGGIIAMYAPSSTSTSNVTNNGKIEGDFKVGGIIGNASFKAGIKLTVDGGWTNHGEIFGKEYVGGIIGRLYENAEFQNPAITLKRFNNDGNVTGVTYVGGNIGYAYLFGETFGLSGDIDFTMEMCNNEGDISGEKYVGGIVGLASADGDVKVIKNCTSIGKITAECYVGCIAGKLIEISIKECSNTRSTITGLKSIIENGVKYVYAGGMVGYGRDIDVQDCVNDVAISYSYDGACIGGIVGYLYSYDVSTSVTGCTNTENIDAPNAKYVGGIVGYLYCYESLLGRNRVTLTKLENFADVMGKTAVGGIFGKADMAVVTASKIESDGTVSGKENVGLVSGEFLCSSSSTLSYCSCGGTVMLNGSEKFNMFGKGGGSLQIIE